jgi:hypothetical protein
MKELNDLNIKLNNSSLGLERALIKIEISFLKKTKRYKKHVAKMFFNNLQDEIRDEELKDYIKLF